MTSIGPLLDTLGTSTKGVTCDVKPEIERLALRNGRRNGGPADGRPALATDVQMAELIMTLSGTTNGRLATEGFKNLEKRVGRNDLHHLAGEHDGRRSSLAEIAAAPAPASTS